MPGYISYQPQRMAELNGNLTRWVHTTAKMIEGEAKRRAPAFSGTMRKAIISFLGFPVATVAIQAPYAPFVEGMDELGNRVITRKHFVSWVGNPMFEAWARRKYGADTSKPGGLLVWGYNVPFFTDAINDVTPKAQALAMRLSI
jgi:hypothetical protein